MITYLLLFFFIFADSISHNFSTPRANAMHTHVNSLSPTLRVSFFVHIKIAVQCGFLWHKAVPSLQMKSTSECVRAKRVRDVCVNFFISKIQLQQKILFFHSLDTFEMMSINCMMPYCTFFSLLAL